MLILSGIIVTLNGFKGAWDIQYFRFVLLLSSIIPISLRVNLDLARMFYSYQIYSDDEIAGTIPRNSNLPEELGRVQYLLTDKTGTLTKNDMIFKKLSLEFTAFDEDSHHDVKNLVAQHCRDHKGPVADIRDLSPELRQKAKRREKNFVLRDLVTALSVCHNVTPVYDQDEEGNAIKEF